MASSRKGHNAGDKTGKNNEISDLLYCFKGNSQWKKKTALSRKKEKKLKVYH